jgi:hypothetical protein
MMNNNTSLLRKRPHFQLPAAEKFKITIRSKENKNMKTSNMSSPSDPLPITRDLTLAYALSVVIAVIMAVASVAGILYRDVIYPAEELLQAFVPNDVVNLIIGVPMLLGSMWLARSGKLIGLLFWPGALFYVLYNYIVYVFGMPLNWAFLLYLTLLTMSIYTMIGLVASIDGKSVKQRLTGTVPVRVAGGVLAGLGGLFLLLVIGELINALTSQTPVPTVELGLHVADFLISPALVIGGVLLWRREALGYVAGTGLLFQASMLFIGLIMILILQPLLTEAAFILTDIVVTFILGLVCFIPFVLYVRGVVRS